MNREDRIARAQGLLRPGQGALFTEYAHRVLLLGFPSSAGVVLLTGEKRYFLVDFRYIEMAGRIKDGFQVILQENLSVQLQGLAEEEQITEILTDVDVLSLEGFEWVQQLFSPGMVQAAPRLSALLRQLEEEKTDEELACAQKARAIAGRVEARFARYVREGASVEGLKRKLGELRGEEGDESRTFAAEFSIENGDGNFCPAGERLRAGGMLCVQFQLEVGLVPLPWTMRFPVQGLPPVPERDRRRALRELLWEDGSAVLLCGGPNLCYYLGQDPGPGVQLLLTKEGIFLLGRQDPHISGTAFLPAEERCGFLEALAGKEKIQTIYTERGIPMKLLAQWEKLPCRVLPSRELEERIYRRRHVKREEELDRLRAAQAVTDRVFLEALHYIREGMTDVEIQRMVGLLFYEMGSQMDSFNHVCGCGPDTSLPHVKPTGRTARCGDFVMLDIGARVEGYGSDMTRMVGIGKVDEEKQAVYGLVLEAQTAAIQAAQSGAICSQVDAAARDIIRKKGYGDFFLHGLGHPVGCGGREGPRFHPEDTSVLPAGVVMTVEPGVYLPGKFGVRIEDMVYIGESGTENLTRSPKELVLV